MPQSARIRAFPVSSGNPRKSGEMGVSQRQFMLGLSGRDRGGFGSRGIGEVSEQTDGSPHRRHEVEARATPLGSNARAGAGGAQTQAISASFAPLVKR